MHHLSGWGSVLALHGGRFRKTDCLCLTFALVAERKYSQLDKEALAIVHGVKQFHQYVYGRSFTILSDHKPLMYIFDETKSVLLMASARIQRWALTLGG